MPDNRLLLKFLLFATLCILSAFNSYGTHLRAGEIIAERMQCSSLTFKITVTVYTDLESTVLFGGPEDWLEFGDGTRMLIKETPNTPRPDLGPNVGMASFSITHTYAGYQQYLISYSEPNRNDGVLNMDASVHTRFYIETKIILDPFLGCNSTPQLKIAPIDNACIGAAWTHNPGAHDPNVGDSISFELVVPFQRVNMPVRNYRDPNHVSFYTNFAQGNEAKTDEPTFRIGTDGTVSWDAPGSAGEYNIAFNIREWRKVDGQWYTMGYVRRDMQILVGDCDNNRPDLIVPQDICVEAGTIIKQSVVGTDVDNDPVQVQAFSQVFELVNNSPATFHPDDSKFYPQPARFDFQWKTTCNHVREQPYAIVFRITDNSPNGQNLITYKTWFIKVVAPKPVISSVNVDAINRSATLKWQPYVCQTAENIQVWRRVDSAPFIPDSCQTGMPESLGYELVATLPTSADNAVTGYFDNNNGKGLAAGARYCYRIVATFPEPQRGESYVSDEICTAPILLDVPAITNVSITKTAVSPDGEVFLRWIKPIDLDRTKFPGPLGYKVLRANGSTGDAGITDITGTGAILDESDTIFNDIGGNTRDRIYNYRIVLLSNGVAIDTSAVASTVRLEASNQSAGIKLSWQAIVPWSNAIAQEPNDHEIFKGIGASENDDLVLLQSVDPLKSDLFLTDAAIDVNQLYCYRVMTRGAYGNPEIISPLENYSQVVCIETGGSGTCVPVLTVKKTECAQFLMQTDCVSSFENSLTWTNAGQDCDNNLVGYKVYRSREPGGIYEWLDYAGDDGDGIVRDTFFIDKGPQQEGLSSMAYCYRVSAIDRSGNEGMSEESCNDNCPYYELTNVFTPDDPDDCNRFFSAWRELNYYKEQGGEGEWKCGTVEQRCARFVNAVNILIFNRWGKEVYRYKSGGERTIYVDWDGRAQDGTELASGIYYYSAEVSFDVMEPKQKTQTIKGWVHLIR